MNNLDITSSRPMLPMPIVENQRFTPNGMRSLVAAALSNEILPSVVKSKMVPESISGINRVAARLTDVRSPVSESVPAYMAAYASQSAGVFHDESVHELFRTLSDPDVRDFDIARLINKNHFLEGCLFKAFTALHAVTGMENIALKSFPPLKVSVARGLDLPDDFLEKIKRCDLTYDNTVAERYLIKLNNKLIDKTYYLFKIEAAEKRLAA